MDKLRSMVRMSLDPDHTMNQKPSWDWRPGTLTPKPVLLYRPTLMASGMVTWLKQS